MKDTAYFTEVNDSRAIILPDGTTRVQGTRRSPKYHIIDPGLVSEPLQRAGFKVERRGKLMKSRPGWAQALSITARHELAPGYTPTFKMLFDNSGRHALKIVPGAFRCECTNEFHSHDVAWRCRHDEVERVAEFLADPVAVFEELMSECAVPLKRLGRLHGVELAPSWRDYMRRAKPRIRSVVEIAWKARYSGDRDAWGFTQALTEVKRVGAQDIANVVLGEGFEDMLAGRLPAAMSRELARADVKGACSRLFVVQGHGSVLN